MRVTARHSTWSRETENKTSPGAQQPLKMGETLLLWGKIAVDSKGGLQTHLHVRQNLVCITCVCDFPLHLQAVLGLNSSFASPVTCQTSRWHPESCSKGPCWAALATKHLPLVSSAIPSASVKAGCCTPLHHPLMCAWQRVSTESAELANKCLDDSFWFCSISPI